MDAFSLLTQLITSSLATTATTPDIHRATGLPVAQIFEIYTLPPSRHFCRVRCPFCGGEHSHGVDLAQLLQREEKGAGVGPRKAHCTRLGRAGGDYWIAADEWRRRGLILV